MAFPVPANEKERLELLEKLNLLVSMGEEAYDFVTKVAAKVLDAPIALITLLDDNWQHYLSQAGSGVDDTPSPKTLREHAFCAYNIVDRDLLIVEDATKDDRFKDNPYVIEDPRIRFYAGAPIEVDDDVFLGSVCVLDTKPRKLTEEQHDMLEALGRQVSYLVRMRKLATELGLTLQEVSDLKQLIPKCSRCGSIRTDDPDYWTSVDHYLEHHIHTELSEAICPDCSKELNLDLDLV